MAVQYEQYRGTRSRCQRVNDAKLFNGWVVELTAETVRIQIDDAPEFSNTDRVAFEIFGQVQNIFMMAQFEKQVNGGFEFRIMSNMRLSPPKESVRLLADRLGVFARFTKDGEEHDAHVVDIATGGVGITSWVNLEKGDEITITFETPYGEVSGQAEVRYSKPVRDGSGYRIGLRLGFEDRVSKGRWNQVLIGAQAA